MRHRISIKECVLMSVLMSVRPSVTPFLKTQFLALFDSGIDNNYLKRCADDRLFIYISPWHLFCSFFFFNRPTREFSVLKYFSALQWSFVWDKTANRRFSAVCLSLLNTPSVLRGKVRVIILDLCGSDIFVNWCVLFSLIIVGPVNVEIYVLLIVNHTINFFDIC